MKISQEGIELIKKFEGCRTESYRCSANVPTIGYGHTAGVKDGDICTKEEAESLLASDLEEFENYVGSLVDVDLEPHQFDALVALTFNLGRGSTENCHYLAVTPDY